MLDNVELTLKCNVDHSCKLSCSYVEREFRLLESDFGNLGRNLYVVEYLYDGDIMWRKSFDDFVDALECYRSNIRMYY